MAHSQLKSEPVFDKKFIWQLIIQGILLGVIVSLSQKYFESWLGPPTALETLRIENNLNTKVVVYQEAIQLLLKQVETLNISGDKSDTSFRNRGKIEFSEIELNYCYTRLCLYADDPNIPIYFLWILAPKGTPFQRITPAVAVYKFLSLIRKDLHNGDIKLDSASYKFLYETKTDTLHNSMLLPPVKKP